MKILLVLHTIYTLLFVSSSFAQTIPLEIRLNDLEFVTDMLDEYYPFWWLKSSTANGLRSKYLPKIKAASDNASEHYPYVSG